MLTIAFSFIGLAPGLVPATVGAASPNITDNVCKGSESGSGQTGGCTKSNLGEGSAITEIGKKVVNLISIIVGIISIIFIIYGGFRYITSGGDSGKVGNAKNTLIYAVIGLIVVALAQVIVNFVLTTSTTYVT